MKKRLEKEIKRVEKELARHIDRESKSRAKWTKRYHRFLKASEQLADLVNTGTKKAQKLKGIIKAWKTETEFLTKDRDAHRANIQESKAKLADLNTRLAVLLARLEDSDRRTNEIVDQVFALNDAVVSAFRARNDYLSSNVYDMLIKPDGTLHRQVTITSTDGLRRVVALVNSITRVDTALANEAKCYIDQFFERFSEKNAVEVDDTVKALIEILQNILIEHVSFKVGPDLYRFISISIDGEAFPELKSAQHLLRHSLRSEKTNSYIRLYQRNSRTDNWCEVKLS